MEYQLSQVHEKLKQMADKMGSDYFQLPVFLNFFETATFKFVGEKLRIIEKTQEVTDDIASLIIPWSLDIAIDPNDNTRYVASLPANYHRTVSYDIVYSDSSRCRRADKITQAEYYSNLNNPNKKPTKFYPIIMQESGMFFIDCGSPATPAKVKGMYCKKPTFATTGDSGKRIVNLPDDAIENILLMTVTNLFGKTADKRVQIENEFEKTFRKAYV